MLNDTIVEVRVMFNRHADLWEVCVITADGGQSTFTHAYDNQLEAEAFANGIREGIAWFGSGVRPVRPLPYPSEAVGLGLLPSPPIQHRPTQFATVRLAVNPTYRGFGQQMPPLAALAGRDGLLFERD